MEGQFSVVLDNGDTLTINDNKKTITTQDDDVLHFVSRGSAEVGREMIVKFINPDLDVRILNAVEKILV